MDKQRPVSPVNGQPIPVGGPLFGSDDRSRELGRKGGKNSAKKRRERITLRQELEMLLTETIHDKNGNAMVAQKAISTTLIKAALNGNIRAFEIIRDTIGEKPVEKVDIAAADYTALDKAYKAMKNDSGEESS